MIDQKLYTLIALAESKSFTKAAKELSLTQPAVTIHVKQLEEELDLKIFNRSPKGLKITNEGEIVLQFARRSIALYKAMETAVHNEKKHSKSFTVGLTHTAESNAVAEVLGKFSSENPGTTITIITDDINNLYEMLVNYEIDLAVVEGKSREQGINSVLLDTDSLVLVTSKNHPLAKKNMVSIDEIKEEPLILRRPSSGTRNLFTAHLESQNISLDEFNLILEVDNVATIKDLIRREIGISILARSVCLDELKKGKIAVLPIENLSMIREINILYQDDFKYPEVLHQILNDYRKIKENYLP